MNPRTRRQRRQTRKWNRPGRVLTRVDSVAGFSHSSWKRSGLSYGRRLADRLRWQVAP